MKVLINGLIIDSESAGIGRYGQNLFNSLTELKSRDLNINFLLQKNVNINLKNVLYKRNFKNSYDRIFYEQFILPFQIQKYDLIHFIDYSSPIIKINKPFITTIHDLSYYIYPKTFKYGSLKLKEILTPISIKRSSAIIVDSLSTKKDVIKFFPEVEDKIKVIYPWIHGFYKITDKPKLDKIKEKYNIVGKYILGVGTIEPRKNTLSLINAFKIVRKEVNDIKLVLVGKKGWLYKDVINEIYESAIETNIIYTGYVEQDDMKYIYSGAECFVYPSLYEGFGLPPLEAMSCGTPVITSNVSSLPEVVGDAGIMVEPMNIEDIASSICKILFDKGLKKKLISEGINQSKMFNKDISIAKLIQIYEKCI